MNKETLLTEIKSKISDIEDELKEGYSIKNLNNMVIEDVINNNIPIIINTKDYTNITDLNLIEKASREIYNMIRKIKEELELDEFMRNNKSFDTVKLKKLYKEKKIIKKFPNFDIDKYLRILDNPITEIKNFKGHIVKYDLFWVRKQLIAINQMIFNEMDLYILNIGKEGCLSSDTKIQVSRCKNSYKYSIKKLYEMWVGLGRVKKPYRDSYPLYVRSYTGAKVRLHKIKDVIYSGKKMTYELKLESGETIKATDNHKFISKQGWKELSELSVNDEILIDQNKPKKNYNNFSQGIVSFSKIISIEKNKIEDTYDIECEDPYHNFVANNIIVHNSGKSCWSSQQILFFYTILTKVGLIDYAYDIKKLFFADLLSFLEENNIDEIKDYFIIKCLDEGNELNRGNYRDETNQQFKYEMRTERKMLRIIMINMQQIGELDTSISLSRVNFIYDCKMKGNKRMGTLEKGYIDMYIIPRGNIIYSEKYKKLLSSNDILNSFAIKLDKKKDYYIGLPKDKIIHQFKFKDTWGFDKEKYDTHVKKQLSKKKFQKTIKLTVLQAYIMLTKLNDFKRLKNFNLKDDKDKKMYDVLYQFFKKLEDYFNDNPDKIIGLERYYDKVYKEDKQDIIIKNK